MSGVPEEHGDAFEAPLSSHSSDISAVKHLSDALDTHGFFLFFFVVAVAFLLLGG